MASKVAHTLPDPQLAASKALDEAKEGDEQYQRSALNGDADGKTLVKTQDRQALCW